MKKIFTLLFCALLFGIVLSSCNKEDKHDALNGTTWVGYDDSVKQTFHFEDGRATYTLKSGAINWVLTYTYSVSDPFVYMTAEEDDAADLRGTISENSMVVINTSTVKQIAIVYKQ